MPDSNDLNNYVRGRLFISNLINSLQQDRRQPLKHNPSDSQDFQIKVAKKYEKLSIKMLTNHIQESNNL